MRSSGSRWNDQALRALVRDTEVHKAVYVDPGVFQIEMERVFRAAWVYVGHASQIPQPGDYFTTQIGSEPVVMVREASGAVSVLINRCAHKGVRLVSEGSGNTGKFFRCPYHAWTFGTDGALQHMPMREGYQTNGLEQAEARLGLARAGAVEVYRDFVFCRLNAQGIGFAEFFGDSLSTIDNMVDRSPEGKLVVAGGVLRYLHQCNWKMLAENQTDACHPMVAHESSAGTTVRVWGDQPEGTPKPMAVEQFAPFVNSYRFFDNMGIRIWPNGHGHTGVSDSIHAAYSPIPGYFEAMVAAYGKDRAERILGEVRHNTMLFPNIMVKGPIQTLRVFKPIAVDRTLVESWTFKLVGAPDLLFERTCMYNRLINSPASIVGHDDLEVYERAQQGLQSDMRDWVNIGRWFKTGEGQASAEVVRGTSEAQMRNQFRAWLQFIGERTEA
jgi:benzoate/toluate 1,2-dioxygenase alpha subunit